MKKVVLIISIVLLILAAAGVFYFYKVYLPAQANPEPEYKTTKVRTGDIVITASGVGNILPKEKVSLGFQVSGVLQSLNVTVGDSVVEGDILATLNDYDLRLRVAEAETSLSELFSPEAINQAEIDKLNAESHYVTAENNLIWLISPKVYYWESQLAEAEAALESLESAASSSETERQAAEESVRTAEAGLAAAWLEYETTYLYETFPYSYKDEQTGELVESTLKPTAEVISLARAELRRAAFNLADAEEYLAALQRGISGLGDDINPLPGSNLSKLLQAKINYDRAVADLEKASVESPLSGTVTEVSASVGQVINTNPFITIETLDKISLKFYLDERDISLVNVGGRVIVTFDAYPDTPIEGTITYLEPALTTFEGSSVAVAWADLVELAPFTLLSGMSADVEVIAAETRNALLVPVQALREISPGSYSVFVLQPDGSLRMVVVTVGLMDYANAEILSGLKQGDVVSTGIIETK